MHVPFPPSNVLSPDRHGIRLVPDGLATIPALSGKYRSGELSASPRFDWLLGSRREE
jgi:hypothetical protein